MTVLVLTRPLSDPCADLVIDELHTRGVPVRRMDPEDFPTQLIASSLLETRHGDWSGTWRGQHQDLCLEDVTAVYYRRPGIPRPHPTLPAWQAAWAQEEALAGCTGVLSTLRCMWINHPRNNRAADLKPVALATAARCGLRVPRTLITNNPTAARAFISSLPGQVAAYKALTVPGLVNGAQFYPVWTRRVELGDITQAVTATACLFQEWIDKAFEVRLTVVGDRMFAGEIHGDSEDARIDFRRDYDSLTYKVCDVPDDVARGVRRLMDVFDLRYAALDFLVSPDTHWHLVDVNPNGQWGFIPELRQPITQALADVLEGRRS